MSDMIRWTFHGNASFEAVQWYRQPVAMLPEWVTRNTGLHVAGDYLHMFVRHRTLVIPKNDWIIRAPDDLPIGFPNSLFQVMCTAVALEGANMRDPNATIETVVIRGNGRVNV